MYHLIILPSTAKSALRREVTVRKYAIAAVFIKMALFSRRLRANERRAPFLLRLIFR